MLLIKNSSAPSLEGRDTIGPTFSFDNTSIPDEDPAMGVITAFKVTNETKHPEFPHIWWIRNQMAVREMGQNKNYIKSRVIVPLAGI